MRDRRDPGTLDLHSGGVLFGYARVSTGEQDLTQQIETLTRAGCGRVYQEKVSGAKRARPQLDRMLDHLRAGDTVVVTRLDRLARSTRDLLEIGERLRDAGANLKSLAEPWADTTSPAGKMVLTIFAGVAEFERSLILARTSEGRRAARERGVRFGRTPSLSPDQLTHARALVDKDGKSIREVAELFGVHRTTLWRSLQENRD